MPALLSSVVLSLHNVTTVMLISSFSISAGKGMAVAPLQEHETFPPGGFPGSLVRFLITVVGVCLRPAVRVGTIQPSTWCVVTRDDGPDRA